MKYIKLFEAKSQREMKQQFKEEFQDFCEQHLAYLLDGDGVSLVCTNQSYALGAYVKVSFKKPVQWDHIKDHIIPFYHYLEQTYYLKNSLLELEAFEIDGVRNGSSSKYYDMSDTKFKDWLGRNLPYEYSMDKILIYDIRIYLDEKRVYGQFDLERYKK
jgi:hypothetical protein